MKPEVQGYNPERYTVIVRGLVLMGSIGIRRAERDRSQRVRVSVELTAMREANPSAGARTKISLPYRA